MLTLCSWKRTLQEHFLSRRTLVFGTRELWWTCEGAISFDTLPTQRLDHVPVIQRKQGGSRFALEYWRSIVRDYTRRFLTWPNDKLPAIAGVAQVYSQFFNCRYLAGLWENSLESELMWCSNRSDITRPLAQRAPSWSWASVDGEIHHKWCEISPDPTVTIIECHITPVSHSSSFGLVDPTRTFLRVRCALIEASWQSDRQYISTLQKRTPKYHGRDEERGTFTRAGRTQADALESNVPDEVWILPLSREPVRGLILVRVENEVYRRVGLVLRLWSTTSILEPERTITIF